MAEMTEIQRNLCREALGLHRHRKSCGNSLHGTFENAALTDAVKEGWMRRRKVPPEYLGYGRNIWEYRVTAAGGIKVLQPGEKLDPFDFPGISDEQYQLQLERI